MKKQILISLMTSILMASCGAKKSTQVESINNETREKITNLFSKSGFKCTFTSADGTAKDIFISEEVKDSAISVSLHDYRENGKITLVGASLNGFLFHKISMKKSMVAEEEVRQGTTVLSSSNKNLNEEGKVLLTTGRLTLTNDMLGVVERVILIMKEDNSTTTQYEEVGRIQHCIESSAKWG